MSLRRFLGSIDRQVTAKALSKNAKGGSSIFLCLSWSTYPRPRKYADGNRICSDTKMIRSDHVIYIMLLRDLCGI